MFQQLLAFFIFPIFFLCPFGIFISTNVSKCLELLRQCCNARYLGLSISTSCGCSKEICYRKVAIPSFLGFSFLQTCQNACRRIPDRVATPSLSGFPFLRCPLKTIIKSMVPHIIFEVIHRIF